jgi:hypothetical protein
MPLKLAALHDVTNDLLPLSFLVNFDCVDKFKEGYKKKGKGKTKDRPRLSESEPDVPLKEEPEPEVKLAFR